MRAMHSLWYIPELLVHIVLYLDEGDVAKCYNVTHHWRQTLKHTLCPHQRPLPDPEHPSNKQLRPRSLPDHIPTAAAHIKTQIADWSSNPILPFLEDQHFYWRESIFEGFLDTLKPCFHPFLAHNACEFVDGLDELAEGRMNITLRTQCQIKDFAKLQIGVEDLPLDNAKLKENIMRLRQGGAISLQPITTPSDEQDQPLDLDAWIYLPLAQPLVTSVVVSCIRGGLWDHSNKSVLSQKAAGCGLWFIKVEREKGVRLRDVLDELRGVLLPIPEISFDGTLVLQWKFGTGVH